MLTIEDVITSGLQDVNEFYMVHTDLISLQEFSAVTYDFCVVSHSISGSNNTFTFEIHNTLWKGLYYFLDSSGDYIDSDATYDGTTNSISITTTSESVQLGLYLTVYTEEFNLKRTNQIFTVNPSCKVPLSMIGEDYEVTFKDLSDDSTSTETITLTAGVSEIINNSDMYMECFVVKTKVLFDDTPTVLAVGIKNKVPLRVNSAYLPSGALVDDPLNIIVIYNGNTLEVSYDETLGDYCFELDLTNKLDTSSETVTIHIYENDYVKESIFNRTYTCNYVSISSFEELTSNITLGLNILSLSDDIVFNNQLLVPHGLEIIGNNHHINLSGYSITISNNNSFKLSNANVINGNPCIIQQKNTKVTLETCTFKESYISDKHKGSIISSTHETATANINNCFIDNCPHSIWYGGTLTIKDTKALYNQWSNNIDTDYSMFLTMFDGNLSVIGNTFDIDLDITDLCTNETDIEFASSLIGVGEDTIFNTYSTPKLAKTNGIPLWDYNNQSHIYIKYYYTELSTCVIMSPEIGKENKSACHTILGTDYVYKDNVQITTVDSENENTIRTIKWR